MPKEASPVDNLLWLRIFFLSILILIINFWSLHHLGSDVTQLLMANGPLLLIAVYNFLMQAFQSDKSINITARFRRWLVFFIKTPVLAILFGVTLLFGSTVSSVSIMASGASESMKVILSPEGYPRSEQEPSLLDGPNDIRKYIKFTTPFGRAFYMEVEGYLRHSFDLYPWIGKRIRVTRDLIVSPSIIIRVPIASQMGLSKGKVKVKDGESVIAEADTNDRQGAIIVGHNVAIPNTFLEKWKMEFIADEIMEAPAARCLLRWQQPIVVRPKEPLTPGKEIEATFLINNIVQARAIHEIKSKKIQDVHLLVEEVNP